MDRGLKILLDTYWCSKGWKKPLISDEDFEIAKNEGYMFDYPAPVSHEETLDQIREITSRISPPHKSTEDHHCYCCGWYPWKITPDAYELNHGLNVLNFERYKWGGVRHVQAHYALFDLQQFLKLAVVEHTAEDEGILHDILD